MAVFEGSFSNLESCRFAIVIARFNDLISEKLLAGCQDCLKRHGVNVDPNGDQVDYAWVPGCFELPLVARQLAISHRYDAIICLGAVIRGQTPHFDYVAAEVSKGIAATGQDTGVPVVFGIVTTDNMQQALERAGIKSNMGWNYAMTALEMASLMQQLRQSMPSIYGANTPTNSLLPNSSIPPAANLPQATDVSPSLPSV
jgi:6,7-dimethyl-8-ribityllumazine synthase